MSRGVRWHWQHERRYRTTLLRLAGEKGRLVQTLPSPPFQPIKVYFSDALTMRIALSPEPLNLCLTSAIRSIPQAVERFLAEFAGADYEHTFLLGPTHLPINAQQGSRVMMPVVIGWWRGHVSIVAPSDLPLGENYYVDRVLLTTELNHACQYED